MVWCRRWRWAIRLKVIRLEGGMVWDLLWLGGRASWMRVRLGGLVSWKRVLFMLDAFRVFSWLLHECLELVIWRINWFIIGFMVFVI
jgi:hypothetical protein